MTSEDREGPNSKWPPVHGVLCSKALNLGTKHFRKTFKVSFPTKLGLPVRLVTLLRSSELKKMHLHLMVKVKLRKKMKILVKLRPHSNILEIFFLFYKM